MSRPLKAPGRGKYVLGAGSSLRWKGQGRQAGHEELQPHVGPSSSVDVYEPSALDQRLRIRVNKVRFILKKLFVEGEEAHYLTISTSVGNVREGQVS